MVYTIKELKMMLAGQPLKSISAGSGVHHVTLWRLVSGRQEAKEGTLIKLTDYVRKAMQDA
jgi:hypothetical protein